jgi:hypothetical protein
VKQFYHVLIYQHRRQYHTRRNLGRKAVLVGFWIAGFVLGELAWFLKAPMLQAIENMGLSAETGQALISGLFGSIVMVLAVLVWSFLSSN